MALPAEPRQKMINIMYLVLTALLALNVSSEILNAFETIDGSLINSNKYLNTKAKDLIKNFDNESILKEFGYKVAIWKPQAVKVNDISESLYNQIEKYKLELKKEAGQKPGDTLYKKDDLEAGTRLFLNGKPGETNGEKLYSLLENYKVELSKIDSLKNQVALLPNFTQIPKSENKGAEFLAMSPAQQWSNIYFHMTPAVAAVTMLSKFQNDIRNTQTQLIDYCFRSITTVPVPPPTLAAFAYSSSNMLMVGDELTITAGLGAFQSETKPTITIDGSPIALNADGQAVLKTSATSAGDFTKHVVATFKDPKTGVLKSSPFDVKYKVGIPTGLALSVDSTKVFYPGIPDGNPISISGAIGGAGTIKVSVAGGAANIIQKGPGRYNVFPNSVGVLTLNITDSKNTRVEKITVKPLPEPEAAFVVGLSSSTNPYGGTAGIIEFKSALGLATRVPADFLFKGIKYKIKSFTMRFSGIGFPNTQTVNVNGNSFPTTSEAFKKCTSGTTVQITDIVAEDAAKMDRKLKNTISYFLK